MIYDAEYLKKVEETARERRWKAQAKARVIHPKYGSVIVPHCSNLAAIENAAEFWGCDYMEIIGTAEVWAVEPDEGPVRRPREFCKRV